ncbi:hypothetical protein BC937DRAFT_87893 [Endogone sp. FLAS-F59071]|nr:hypothetical protein BC937DRAFT_87893 [Endogone sp. FLAS-F59071]|eukprot:RUS19178.1 hypothetical protein BC937DRAFT_87893 [Endogone sp. FLAS-F59071]
MREHEKWGKVLQLAKGGHINAKCGHKRQSNPNPTISHFNILSSPSTMTEEFPEGYFFIKSHKNGMVLDVEEASKQHFNVDLRLQINARVIVWPQKFRDNANQLWSHDNGFIINKCSGLGKLWV